MMEGFRYLWLERKHDPYVNGGRHESYEAARAYLDRGHYDLVRGPYQVGDPTYIPTVNDIGRECLWDDLRKGSRGPGKLLNVNAKGSRIQTIDGPCWIESARVIVLREPAVVASDGSCSECWGTGSYRGWGADCSQGCKK